MLELTRGHSGRLAAHLRRPASFALVALLLAGCAGTLPESASKVSALPDPPKRAEPIPAAQREHQRILAAYGGAYQNPRMEAVLKQTVDKLVASSEKPDLKYRVTILNSPAINAFALPTGHLYVTRGLLALANDDSELASVLSHEMAHVIARHAAMREDQARQAAIVSRVVNDVLNDPQMGALALAKSKIALASFSRAQEIEADGIGVGIAAKAGYDPYGASRFLTAMGRNAALKSSTASGGDPRSIDFLSSHPSTPERVKNALATARQYTAPAGGDADHTAYLAATEGLAYGEDPTEGLIRGRTFLHPRLGFTFTAPEGFVLDNTAQAILGMKDNGSQALRLDNVRVPADQKLTDYLVSGWIEKVDPRTVQETTINNSSAATAIARGDQWSFRLYVVRYGQDVYRFVFAAKNRTPEVDRAFRQSVTSFRRMSQAEIDRARPLHIHIVTVQPGDTPEKMASKMTTDHPLERFLVLNGLNPGATLTPGRTVKIVTE
ncbi:MAG: M48 family metalloprotease [Variibacter sp.]